MSKKYLLFTIISLFILQKQANSQKPAKISRSLPETVQVIKDIPYVIYEDRELLLDIYKPANGIGGQLPTILVIRGGAWARGDKEGFGSVAAALADRGFATVCIEYRASDEALFPAAVLDTKSAIKWIKYNAINYNFDAINIGVIGGSAGAHLAVLLGTSSKVNSLNPTQKIEDFSIQAVVGLATPSDFKGMTKAQPVIKWLGKPYENNEELWMSASPISYVDKDSPPMLLIHSSSDNVVPYGQSILAAEKLGKVGVYSELILIPDAPHAFWNSEEWFGYSMDKAASFFHEQLKN